MAWIRAASGHEGQDGHSSHRGQASRCLPSEHTYKRLLQRGGEGSPTPQLHHSRAVENLQFNVVAATNRRNFSAKWEQPDCTFIENTKSSFCIKQLNIIQCDIFRIHFFYFQSINSAIYCILSENVFKSNEIVRIVENVLY